MIKMKSSRVIDGFKGVWAIFLVALVVLFAVPNAHSSHGETLSASSYVEKDLDVFYEQDVSILNVNEKEALVFQMLERFSYLNDGFANLADGKVKVLAVNQESHKFANEMVKIPVSEEEFDDMSVLLDKVVSRRPKNKFGVFPTLYNAWSNQGKIDILKLDTILSANKVSNFDGVLVKSDSFEKLNGNNLASTFNDVVHKRSKNHSQS